MKTLFTLTLLLFTLCSYSQKVDKDKIDLHLIQYNNELREGKAFAITGLVIGLAGAVIGQGTGNDKDAFASALGCIGASFSAYGIIRVFNSGRHLKKIKWYSEQSAFKN